MLLDSQTYRPTEGYQTSPGSGRGNPDQFPARLIFGEAVGILAASFDQRGHQRVAVAASTRNVADVVAALAHSAQVLSRSPGVKPTALPMRRCLVEYAENQRNPLLGSCHMAQHRVSDRQSGHSARTVSGSGV